LRSADADFVRSAQCLESLSRIGPYLVPRRTAEERRAVRPLRLSRSRRGAPALLGAEGQAATSARRLHRRPRGAARASAACTRTGS
jgi:hypothetical protein